MHRMHLSNPHQTEWYRWQCVKSGGKEMHGAKGCNVPAKQIHVKNN